MITSFTGKGTVDIFDGKNSKAAARTCPAQVWAAARRKLDQLNQAEDLNDLRMPPGNRLESLKSERKGQHSVRINDKYRVCFVWTPDGPDCVEIVDYH